MVYDAFAHNPIFALEGLGFVQTGEAGAFIEDGHTRPGGSLPMNTNGGGLSYAHSGSYGMLCMLESNPPGARRGGRAGRGRPDVAGARVGRVLVGLLYGDLWERGFREGAGGGRKELIGKIIIAKISFPDYGSATGP